MEENLLQNPIKEFFTRILELQGTLRHIERILLKDLKSINSKELLNSGVNLSHGSHLIIGDLTGPDANGWKINYPTGISRVIEVENYQKEIDSLIKRESAYMKAQAYEAFETFLKDITATYLFLNKYLATQISEEYQQLLTLEEYKNTLRKSLRRKGDSFKGANNEGFFNFFKSQSTNYKNFESHNNSGLKIREWYEVYSEVRHAIIHSGNFIKEERLKEWNKNKFVLLRENFPYTKSGASYKLEISSSSALKTLNMISELAFQVFKFLSIEANLDWKILLHMNKDQ